MFNRTDPRKLDFPLPNPFPPLRRPIRGSGQIVARLDERRVLVRMPNGYETQAHWPANSSAAPPAWRRGDTVELEFSPYDMRQARILPDRR